MLSRAFGFIRDLMIATFLGTGPVAEAFFIAFSLPNMFRRFFAEGAFNTAFIPLFSKKLEANEAPHSFAQNSFAALGSILIALTLIAQLTMPWLVLAIASGFAGDIRFELAVDYGRIVFIYVLFISLAALLAGILNANGFFSAAAAAPVFLNIILIGAIGLAITFFTGDKTIEIQEQVEFKRYIGQHLVWGVVIAGIAQFALVWWASSRIGFSLWPTRPRITPDLRRLAIIAAPAMLSAGVMQINLLVGRQVGSFFDGAIAWLSFADRLYQLPLGVIGIAIGVVLLPALSRKIQSKDTDGSRIVFNRAVEMAMTITIPSSVALLIIPEQLVSVLFQRGAFTPHDVTETAAAVAIYGIGLPAFVMQKVLQTVYFAQEDTKAPFRYAVISMIINAVVAISMAYTIGFIGAAIGTTVAGWVMLWLLATGARKKGNIAMLDEGLKSRLPKMVISAGTMGVTLFLLSSGLEPILLIQGWRWLAIGILILGGTLIYFGIGYFIGAFRAEEFRKGLHDRKK